MVRGFFISNDKGEKRSIPFAVSLKLRNFAKFKTKLIIYETFEISNSLYAIILLYVLL